MKLQSLVLGVAAAVVWATAAAQHQHGSHGGSQAASHVPDCTKRAGIEKARCERHTLMFAKCGSVKGDAHFACDREFLLANPLDCKTVGDGDAKACAAEVAAMKTCEPKAGREFVTCVRDETKSSPMGH